jgi:hypothetical protein
LDLKFSVETILLVLVLAKSTYSNSNIRYSGLPEIQNSQNGPEQRQQRDRHHDGPFWEVLDGRRYSQPYYEMSEKVDMDTLEGLNLDSEFGGVETLFDMKMPSAFIRAKNLKDDSKDWIESDVDEQLILMIR